MGKAFPSLLMAAVAATTPSALSEGRTSPRLPVECSTARPLRMAEMTPAGSGIMVPEPFEVDAMQFTADPFTAWIEANRAEMARHIGRFVVIDANEGIVAEGDDPVELELAARSRTARVMVTFVSPTLDAAL